MVVGVAVKRVAYANVSRIEVTVALEDVRPVVDGCVEQTLVLMAERLGEDIAVFGALINRERIAQRVEQEHIVVVINDGVKTFLRDVAELCASVAECEQHIAVLIVCVHAASLLVDYRPGAFRTDCDVDDSRRACRRAVNAHVVDVDLA